MGKKRLTRKEDHPTTRIPAPLESSAAPELPAVYNEGRPSNAGPPADQSKDGFFRGRNKTRLLGLLLFLFVAVVFLPALWHDFVNYDDPVFVTENVHVKEGFTWANVRWAFLSADIDFWRPLSWLSHMADCEIFGLRPWGHHLTNVLLHALNALLVFAVLRKMTGAVWRSLLVAALFGLHPLHVESVAWIAERKDLIGTLFWLLTLWAYANWVQRRAAQKPRTSVYYGLALAFLALGLMSKPMLVTVPCVLLLLDFWPLNRLGSITSRPSAATVWSLVVEKVPFFVLAGAVGVLTVFAQGKVGALKTDFPWPDRIANSLISYCRYLGKCGFPSRLAVFYPHPSHQSVDRAVLAGMLLAGVTIAVCLLGRKRPYLPFGWFWFLGTLVPVIGLVQVGDQSMADRYSYMPLVGVFIMAAWAAGDAAARWPHRIKLLSATAGVILAICAILSSRQLGFWQNSSTLFRHALAVTQNNWTAHVNLGATLLVPPERLPEAIAEYREAVRIAPGIAETHKFLGLALAKTPERMPEAIAEIQTALRLNPQLPNLHPILASLLAKTPGRESEALAEFQIALRLKPDSADIHNRLADALARKPGRESEAIIEFQTALRIDPKLADAHSNLATLLANTPGRLSDAVAEYEAALRLQPDSAEMHNNLGLALARLPSHQPQAASEFRTALRLNPESAEAHYNLGIALADTPSLPEAIAECRAALKLKPDYADAHYGLGLLLAKTPARLPEAVEEYRAALRLQPDDPKVHNALGNAWSEMPGGLSEAITEFQTALRLQPDFVEVHNNLGLALAQLPGRLPEAIFEYGTALRARPDFAEAHYNLANALSQTPGRISAAIAEYEAAIGINPDYVPAHFDLALLLTTIPGQTSRAIQEYEAAVRVAPAFAEAHFNLGLLLASLPGRRNEAIEHLEAALRFKPDLEAARTTLERLRAAP